MNSCSTFLTTVFHLLIRIFMTRGGIVSRVVGALKLAYYQQTFDQTENQKIMEVVMVIICCPHAVQVTLFQKPEASFNRFVCTLKSLSEFLSEMGVFYLNGVFWGGTFFRHIVMRESKLNHAAKRSQAPQ